MPTEKERWFETATVFWLGAVVPPLGAVLSLAALVDRWRRKLLPDPVRLAVVPLALAPCLWLVWWAWGKATALRFDASSGLYRPLLDPSALDPMERLFLVATLVHYTAGALLGALWGARTAPAGGALVRSGLGAIAGAGWGWCGVGICFLAGRGLVAGPVGLGIGIGILLVLLPVASLAMARWIERGAEGSLEWTAVAD